MQAFYGKEIDPNAEQATIKKILQKHAHKPVSEELQKTIYTELSQAQAAGIISIPFKVVMRNSCDAKHRPYIEIVLDTKV
ncbi:MAG: hypothetical protein S4CHLAM123_01270 [Chlamydiales bacterium]|nr:hypothetical protein [Chlamydiales bacterium]